MLGFSGHMKKAHRRFSKYLAVIGSRKVMRVRDIAEDLGFSDEGAFTRAFRRWTGLTPAGFRRQADERR